MKQFNEMGGFGKQSNDSAQYDGTQESEIPAYEGLLTRNKTQVRMAGGGTG